MNGIEKIRQALDGAKATINYGSAGETFVNLPDRSIQVLPSDTVDDIKAKLSNPFEGKPMSITGFQSGAFEAKMAEIKQRMVDKQAQGLAKIDGKVTAGAAKLDEAVDGVAAKIDAEVDAQLAEFAKFTNGGPA